MRVWQHELKPRLQSLLCLLSPWQPDYIRHMLSLRSFLNDQTRPIQYFLIIVHIQAKDSYHNESFSELNVNYFTVCKALMTYSGIYVCGL